MVFGWVEGANQVLPGPIGGRARVPWPIGRHLPIQHDEPCVARCDTDKRYPALDALRLRSTFFRIQHGTVITEPVAARTPCALRLGYVAAHRTFTVIVIDTVPCCLLTFFCGIEIRDPWHHWLPLRGGGRSPNADHTTVRGYSRVSILFKYIVGPCDSTTTRSGGH